MPGTWFVTRYDFRTPGATPDQRRELFARALEQAAYVDRHGHDALMLSEHHVSEDGYLPSPIPVAAAFAAVTERVPISVAARARARLHIARAALRRADSGRARREVPVQRAAAGHLRDRHTGAPRFV